MVFFTTALFLLIIGIIIYALIKRNSKLRIEKGRVCLFTEFCCGALDGYRAKFLRFSVYSDFIVIGYAQSIVIKANEINSVSQENYFGAKGLSIKHNRRDLPSIILFLNDYYGAREKVTDMIKT